MIYRITINKIINNSEVTRKYDLDENDIASREMMGEMLTDMFNSLN